MFGGWALTVVSGWALQAVSGGNLSGRGADDEELAGVIADSKSNNPTPRVRKNSHIEPTAPSESISSERPYRFWLRI